MFVSVRLFIASFLKAYLCSQGTVRRQGAEEEDVIALESDAGDDVPPNLRGAKLVDSSLGKGEDARCIPDGNRGCNVITREGPNQLVDQIICGYQVKNPALQFQFSLFKPTLAYQGWFSSPGDGATINRWYISFATGASFVRFAC